MANDVINNNAIDPCKDCNRNLAATGRKFNSINTIVKKEKQTAISVTENPKFHCSKMPVIMGMINLQKGAIFQRGIV